MEYKIRTAPAVLDDEQEGRFKAAFSVFDEIDSDGDIVRASAFTDGQMVPLVWAHDWTKPIGQGVIHITQKHAEFHGEFWLDTFDGAEAHKKVKKRGGHQEYSFGFQPLQTEKASLNGQTARAITKAEIFEVSPVLIGANRNTRTLAIKGQERFEEQEGRVLADLDELMARAKSLADLRAKEGRSLSTARRSRLEALLASLSEHMTDLEMMLEESAPKLSEGEDGGESAKVLSTFLAVQAELMRSAVGV